MRKYLIIIIIAFGLFNTASIKAQTLNPTYAISVANQADSFKGGYTFSYSTAGTPWNGALISFGGFSNQYDCQISSEHSLGKHISFRTKNGDSWNSWNEIWHSGNLNNVNSDFIARTITSSKININGGTGEGASFDTKMELTKTSSTGNIQSAKIVLNGVDSNFGNLIFKVKTTPSKAELDSFYSDALTIKSSNTYIGIGTNNPIEKLNVNGGTGEGASFDTKMALTKTSSTGNIQSAKIVLNGVDSNFGNLIFKVKTTASKVELDNFYSDAMTIKGSNANVGIGTSNPDSKLTVAGNIHAQEIKVTLNAGAVPDYVFANDYKLKSLQEVEEFIKQNSHLPEIPSAKEIEKNGLMLAEMNMSLLKKIEELTLYSIEQDKKNNIQSEKIEKLERENQVFKSLSERLSKLENQLK